MARPDELCEVYLHALLAGRPGEDARAWPGVVRGCELAGPDEAGAAARVLSAAVPGLPLGRGGPAVRLLGDLVHRGADPAALAPLVERLTAELERSAGFASSPLLAAPFRPRDRFRYGRIRRRFGAGTADCWRYAGEWLPGLLVPLQRQAVRLALGPQDRLAAAAAAAGLPDAAWLYELLRVLDDEPFVVLHRRSGRGWRLTVGGVDSGRQLVTLLAHLLVDGGHLPGEGPRPEWVAAATDGPVRSGTAIRALFGLADAHGWPVSAGTPLARVPVLDGTRVVVLDPAAASGPTWTAGRSFPLMTPTLTLDATLGPGEALRWLDRIEPKRVAVP